MIEPLTTLGLLSAFGTNIVATAAFEWIAAKWKTAGVTNHDLQKALRESYCDALSSIEFGFRRREGLLDSLGKRRLYREITASFDKEFLTPFISETSLSQDELESLAREGAKYCRILREAVDLLLPKEDVPNITIENLLLTGRKLEGADDLRKLNDKAKADLMTKVRSVEGVPKFFFDFLDYKDLLMGSMVFFYGERIKADERVRSILTHAELQRIREEQSKQYQKQAAKLETALQSQMSAFQQFLSPIKDNFAEVLTCLERLEAEWAETTRYLQRILDLISLDKGLSDKDKRQLEAGLSPSFDLHAKYEFDERKPIGYGAVATVYRALHRGLRQVRAIKVLKPEHRENQEVVERFLREAVVLGSLKHANIVQIYDAGGGGPNLDFYLEMEYVEGVTLRNFIKTHEFDWQRILKFIKQLGSAVQKMHESGIIHRDLNPRNIMVDKNGDLKVMDFGVAKIIGVEGLTKDGQVVGTTNYIAPEQARGERVDERADIYSFGVILYELCTRRLPSTPALPLRQYEPGVPEWLENIVEKCLRQDRNLRYANIKEMLAALEKRELEDIRKEKVKEAPLLSIDCERLDFTDVKAGSRASKNFTVKNVGNGKLTGKITASHPWLKVTPTTIDLEPGKQETLVTVDASHLNDGISVEGLIKIDTNGGTGNVDVSLSTATRSKPIAGEMPRPKSRRKWVPFAVISAIGLVALLSYMIVINAGTTSGSDWPMFALNPEHTSASTEQITKLELLWRFPVSPDYEGGDFPPSIVGSKVFFGTYEGMYCLNAEDGKRVWVNTDVCPSLSSPAISGGRVFCNDYGDIYCLSAQNGEVIWNHEYKDVEDYPLTVFAGKVFAGSNDGYIYCLNAQDGELIWKYKTTEKYAGISSVSVSKDRVFFCADYTLYCLDVGNGSLIWKAGEGDYTTYPVISGDKIFVNSPDNDNKVCCLDCKDGHTIWTSNIGTYDAVAVLDSKVFVRSGQGISCLDANSGQLISQWKGEDAGGQPVISGDKLFFGSSNYHVYCFGLEDGKLLWKYETLGQYVSPPAISGGKVFVRTWYSGKYVYCFGTR